MSIQESSFLIGELKRFSVTGLLFCYFVHNVGLSCDILRRIERLGIVFVDLFANFKCFLFLELNFVLKLFLLFEHFFHVMFSWNAGHRHGVGSVDILWTWKRFDIILRRFRWTLGSFLKHNNVGNVELDSIKINKKILF